MQRLARHRILAFALLSATLLAATALRRGPVNADRLAIDRFWATKLSWRNAADCVIAGDSRACRDVVPHILARQAGSNRVLNFAFDSAGYSEDYLQAIEDVLDPASPRRTMVLGITSYALTPAAIHANEFESRRRTADSLVALPIRESLDRLSPIRLDQLGETLASPRRSAAEPDRVWHDDGWVEMRRQGGNENVYVDHYVESFAHNVVDPACLERLLSHVRIWSEAGIRVIAFRPPASESIRAVEDERSGFNESAVAASLARAGATWVTIDPAAYTTYDGSHLGRDEAIRFTTDLSRQIRATDTRLAIDHAGDAQFLQSARADRANQNSD